MEMPKHAWGLQDSKRDSRKWWAAPRVPPEQSALRVGEWGDWRGKRSECWLQGECGRCQIPGMRGGCECVGGGQMESWKKRVFLRGS